MTFADKVQPQIVGLGIVGKNDSFLITCVLLVEGLKHNIMSISQFCDKVYKFIFKFSRCNVKDYASDRVLLSAKRHLNS